MKLGDDCRVAQIPGAARIAVPLEPQAAFAYLRFSNNAGLREIEDVATDILLQLEAPPSPQASPASGTGGRNTPLAD